MEKKQFYIKTFGCKVNQYESQVVRENLLKGGFYESDSLDRSDIVILNTCTVTSTSDAKSFRAIRNAVRDNYKCIVVTGCLVEDNNLDLSKFKGVHYIIKNKDKYRIPRIINSGLEEKDLEARGDDDFDNFITGFNGHTRVFVKVQDGCNNACSYCKVRIARGHSRSRNPEEVFQECKALIDKGTRELVLTGICLGSYGRDLSCELTLSKLIARLCTIEGEWRMRLSSIEPKDVTRELIKELKYQEKLCKHLHIPFQSGDDYILKKMNRPYTQKDYISIVKRLRNAIPDIAISTDIMVGFPEETEQRFKNTENFINIIKPMRIHVFGYSKRKDTEAYQYRDDISIKTKKEREEQLLDMAKDLALQFANKFVTKDVEVLIEGKKTKEGYLEGYTDRYIKVYVKGPDDLIGTLIKTKDFIIPH